MKTYKGEITLIGDGTWIDKGAGGITKMSVFEIGKHTIKTLAITDYLKNYLKIGENSEILVSKGLSQGLISAKAIVGIKVNGKTYKESTRRILFLNLAKIILYFMLSIPAGMLFLPFILLGFVALIYYIKEIVDFSRF